MSDGRFPTTNWSLIWDAGDELAAERRLAIEQLQVTYWSLLVNHLNRRRRLPAHDAEDLVQGFVTNQVLERNLVAAADRDRGRFRNLLIKSLENYVRNEFQKRTAKKRQADNAMPIAPQDVEVWDKQQSPVGDSFDVEWARQLLQTVAERMKEECESSGRTHIWGVFEARVLLPSTEGTPPLDYDDLVVKFKFQSPSQASNALVTAKRMYARTLRAAVAEYAVDAEDAEAELRDLENILAAQ